MSHWNKASHPPRKDGFYDLRCSDDKTRRVAYLEGQWRLRAAGATPVAWREVAPARRPVSELDLFRNSDTSPVLVDENDFVSLEATLGSPLVSTRELKAVAANAKLELAERGAVKGISINVIRCHAMSPNARSVVTGQVLSISQNYSAQAVGERDIVIHENKRLDRPLTPGEEVTVHYQAGMGAVYDGILYDVAIEANDALSREEVAFIRTSILNTLAIAKGRDDEIVKAAAKFALKEGQAVFGWDKPPQIASLKVSDWVSMKLADMLAEQAQRYSGDFEAAAETQFDRTAEPVPVITLR